MFQHDFPAGCLKLVTYNSIGAPQQHGPLTSGQTHTPLDGQAVVGQRTVVLRGLGVSEFPGPIK